VRAGAAPRRASGRRRGPPGSPLSFRRYRGDLVKRGGFVEDKLGQYQLADIRACGLGAHAKYGQFVLDDGVERPMVSHLDGHDALSFRKFKFAPTDDNGYR